MDTNGDRGIMSYVGHLRGTPELSQENGLEIPPLSHGPTFSLREYLWCPITHIYALKYTNTGYSGSHFEHGTVAHSNMVLPGPGI